MTTQEAIEVLKNHKERDDLGSSVYPAIDTVVAHINSENIRGLDEKLDEKVIETPDNQGGLSNKLDMKFSPELLQTYYPFMEEMNELLFSKKLGMATIVKDQLIISRCHLHGMEVGYEAALRFKEMQK